MHSIFLIATHEALVDIFLVLVSTVRVVVAGDSLEVVNCIRVREITAANLFVLLDSDLKAEFFHHNTQAAAGDLLVVADGDFDDLLALALAAASFGGGTRNRLSVTQRTIVFGVVLIGLGVSHFHVSVVTIVVGILFLVMLVVSVTVGDSAVVVIVVDVFGSVKLYKSVSCSQLCEVHASTYSCHGLAIATVVRVRSAGCLL